MSVNAKGSSLPESTLMMVTEGENLLKYTTTNVISDAKGMIGISLLL